MEKPLPGRASDHPSFSASLLDAIYRSLDDQPRPPPVPLARGGALHRPLSPVRRPIFLAGNRAAPVTRVHSNSSSSDRSSSAAFSSSSSSSSSEPESGPVRLKPILTGSPKAEPGKKKKKKKPVSPGARLAGFIGSLFSASPAARKKPSPYPPISLSRSCLNVAPSPRGRAARFCYGGGGVVRDRAPSPEKEVEDEVASHGSSDLFELEDLTVGGGFHRDELPVYGTTSFRNM